MAKAFRPLLSPPQYTLYRKLAGSIGTDPRVEVMEPYPWNGQWLIDIPVNQEQTASTLATVLLPFYNFGGIQVVVRVLDPEGTAITVSSLRASKNILHVKTTLDEAFRLNPYYVRVVKDEAEPRGDLAVVFRPQIIQFWNDNLADYYGYNHYVAQDVFAEVMHLEYPDGTRVSVTTSIEPDICSPQD